METGMLLNAFFAFTLVMSLMFLLSWFLKRIGLAGQSMLPGAKRRLKIIESLSLDHRRKLVIVRRDNKEHLLVLGPNGECVVEANIPVVDNIVELSAQKDVKNA